MCSPKLHNQLNLACDVGVAVGESPITQKSSCFPSISSASTCRRPRPPFTTSSSPGSRERQGLLQERESGEKEGMSRNGKGRVDQKLNLSQHRGGPSIVMNSPRRSSSSSSPSTSPPSSCVSSEEENPSSPEQSSMVLVGCPRCLMYVMLSENDPKCPKCKSTVLLDFLNDAGNNSKGKKNKKS